MKVIKETAYSLQEYMLFHENTSQYESLMQPTSSVMYSHRINL